MFVSAPIPQLSLILIERLDEPEDIENCFMLIEELSTTKASTGIKRLDNQLIEFTQKLKKSKVLCYATCSFLAVYYEAIGNKELADIFKKIMHSTYTNEVPSHNEIGFLIGIFSSCLMSDVNLNNNDLKLPKEVKEAVKFIEKYDLIVHLEKHD